MNDGNQSVKPSGDDRSLTQDRRRLRRRRLAAGLTLREAAARAGCDFSMIAKLENGKRSAGPHTLAALAKAYECEITDLMPPEPKRVAA
jgi:transcriptional regulator with XRE-family HTH domain